MVAPPTSAQELTQSSRVSSLQLLTVLYEKANGNAHSASNFCMAHQDTFVCYIHQFVLCQSASETAADSLLTESMDYLVLAETLNLDAPQIHLIFRWLPRNTNQVDAVTRPRPIRQIVSQMCSIHAHGFTILEASDIVPVDFRVAERWPTMRNTLLDKVVERPFLWGHKEKLARVGVVKFDFTSLFVLLLRLFDEWRGLPVSCMIR
jgi:hypothetical protein